MRNPFKVALFSLFVGLFLSALGACEEPTVSKSGSPSAASASADSNLILRVELKGAITPSSLERLETALEVAHERKARALLVVLDTPGGLASSMDDMIRAILASGVPVISYVSPPGAYCGSAGVYIMYASHIAAMAPATNIGSATPVMIGGGGAAPGPDESKSDGIPEKAGADDAVNLKRKQLNHAVAQIRGLAEFHGRNAIFAERTVTLAENITSTEALAIRAIDLVAGSEAELLAKIEGRTVRMMTGTKTLALKDTRVETIENDFRSKLLAIIANPSISYILMMIGILGIMAEVQYPGAVFPGVIGAICLLLGLYAMQSLPIDYTGFALIALGLVLFILEIKIISYGLLTISGLICLILGSLLLVRSGSEFTRESLLVVLTMCLLVGGTMAFFIYKAREAMRRRPASGDAQLRSETGEVFEEVSPAGGRVYIHSEFWSARSAGPVLPKGAKIRVRERDGMVLVVEAVDQAG